MPLRRMGDRGLRCEDSSLSSPARAGSSSTRTPVNTPAGQTERRDCHEATRLPAGTTPRRSLRWSALTPLARQDSILPDRRSGDRQADNRIDPPPAGPHGGDGQAHQHSGSLGGAHDHTAPLRSARASRKRSQTIHAALVRPDQRDGHALLRSRRKLMSTHPAQARR